jgi:hypothetical protein
MIQTLKTRGTKRDPFVSIRPFLSLFPRQRRDKAFLSSSFDSTVLTFTFDF